eukprot:TRINITY_DN76656_c0_g1_i1.p1 TRINITY_DN76656_c0_g1~~TRINITY_DN76656_c0_g1_i1.p1  ORF type:complete len:673 (+),score=202.99 TRINITY_DN76656_c0_g1_i1:90-2108(+)
MVVPYTAAALAAARRDAAFLDSARPRACRASLLVLILGTLSGSVAAAPSCGDAATCKARFSSLVQDLESSRDAMVKRQNTMRVLKDISGDVFAGKHLTLPSAQRQHLEKVPLISEISHDARHKPLSSNTSQHLIRLKSLAESVDTKFHAVLTLKKAANAKGSSTLLVLIDTQSQLHIYTMEGEPLLEAFDLGHGADRPVTHFALSPNQDTHFVMTGDEDGTLRVHNLKIISRQKKPKKDNSTEEGADGEEESSQEDAKASSGKPKLLVNAAFSASFAMPPGSGGEARKLNALLSIDRNTHTYFLAGDSLGAITVFFRNGTIKGRVRVIEDGGGVQGLLRSQGQSVLFYSSHAFGFFSVSMMDVQYPPCSGWSSPVVDVAPDPSQAYAKVVLALADGDVIVFSTTKGKNKACDLSLKFPHVSTAPFKVQLLKGNVIGMPVPTEENTGVSRDMYFFSLAAMEKGYGLTPSRAVVVQASMKPLVPESFTLLSPGGGGGASGGGGSSSSGGSGKTTALMKFADMPGIFVYELNFKVIPPKVPSLPAGGSGGDGFSMMDFGGEGNKDDSWLNWFPKVGVFGIALIGIVLFNVKKATGSAASGARGGGGGGRGGKGGLDDFDDELFKARLREKREKKKRDKEMEDAGMSGGGGFSGSMPSVGSSTMGGSSSSSSGAAR